MKTDRIRKTVLRYKKHIVKENRKETVVITKDNIRTEFENEKSRHSHPMHYFPIHMDLIDFSHEPYILIPIEQACLYQNTGNLFHIINITFLEEKFQISNICPETVTEDSKRGSVYRLFSSTNNT